MTAEWPQEATEEATGDHEQNGNEDDTSAICDVDASIKEMIGSGINPLQMDGRLQNTHNQGSLRTWAYQNATDLDEQHTCKPAPKDNRQSFNRSAITEISNSVSFVCNVSHLKSE